MSVNEYDRDRDLARAVVRYGLSALETADDVVQQRIGKLSVLSKPEQLEFATFKSRIAAYTALTKPKHPLCLGVFGPPGSGKSFLVEEIATELGTVARVINLSQLDGPADMAAAVAAILYPATLASDGTVGTVAAVRPTTPPVMPIVFFDEFDSRLAGAPLGWLQWLLAPMQDGKLVREGKLIETKRAVFVFAGGTSDSFEEFPDAHADYFRAAKGPDFISRLRGHVNVRGVNQWPFRRVRRATVFRLGIERVAYGLLTSDKILLTTTMSDEVIDEALSVGRFVYGSRSVEALVEMATSPASVTLTSDDLRKPEVLASHVDSGILGTLSIMLSAGGARQEGGTGDYDPGLEDVWTTVATRLVELGSALVYAGDIRPSGFTARLGEAYARLPNPLGRPAKTDFDPMERPQPGRVACFQSVTDPKASHSPPFDRIDVRPLPGLDESELAELGVASNAELLHVNPSPESVSDWKTSDDWCKRLGRALALFRLRAQAARLTDAHIAFGGRVFGSSGRFPGIAEEVMLSLKAGNAVYLCGGFGGAARAVGEVLGFGSPWFRVPDCLRSEKQGKGTSTLEAAVRDWGGRFQLPNCNDLPLNYEELVQFLRSHAIDGSQWPANGLSPDENRILFRSTDADTIIKLVTKGLSLRFKLVR